MGTDAATDTQGLKDNDWKLLKVPVMDGAEMTVTIPDGIDATTIRSVPLSITVDDEVASGTVGKDTTVAASMDVAVNVMEPKTESVLKLDTDSMSLLNVIEIDDVHSEPLHVQLRRVPQALLAVDGTPSDAMPKPVPENKRPWPKNVMPSKLAARVSTLLCPTAIQKPIPKATPYATAPVDVPSPANARPSLE